jgi:uncharacterized protein with FMN-binding domain
LPGIENGNYTGKYTLIPPVGVFVAQNKVEVSVTINDHTYQDISINTQSVKAMAHIGKMRDLIIEHQTLQIDALSGATSLTGKAFLKAIEHALK